MAAARALLGRLKSRYMGMRTSARLLWVGGVAAGVVVLVLVLGGGVGTDMTVLFSGLDQADQMAISERLAVMDVPYETAADGDAILVPGSRVHEVRLALASEGLPQGGGVGFEIFDEQRFGESEFSEQVKYHRALEGELARTISHLAGVRRARVHLVMPTRSLFSSSEQSASASVILHLRPGSELAAGQVRGIVHLLASSVRGLDPERVAIVDGAGRLLGGGASETDSASDTLTFTRNVERSKETAVQQMLDAAIGRGRAVVRVSADVSFRRVEQTEEHYEPDAVAPRNFQITEERGGGAGTSIGGVPGAASNLPGGEAPTTGSGGEADLVRRSETRNFEVSKVMRHAVEPVGQVTHLQVAVLVDGNWTGHEGSRTFEARSTDELERIRGIVATAAGINAERGDQVTIECVPFAPPADDVAQDPVLDALEPYEPVLPYAAGVLLALLLGIFATARWLLGRRRRGRAGAGRSERLLELSGLDSTPGPASLREKALSASAGAQEAEQVRLLASSLAGKEPATAARVVQGWLAEEGS